MSWEALLTLITDELGIDAANRIEARAMKELGGVRLTISARPTVTMPKLNQSPGKPREAAKRIGVHPSTVYRRLVR